MKNIKIITGLLALIAFSSCTLGTSYERYEREMKEIERCEKMKHSIDSMVFATQMEVLSRPQK